MADVNLCSISKSYSQANINHYASLNNYYLRFAFAHLRYFLGGDRPSQTTSHRLSLKISKINN